ncbi:EpsG family protein [Paenibacillus spiritus]|uniref:EpsG family protein n=1 Tax=Paenibacillus spiritus TaxID=2496557 RepID=A0A5J5FUX6_9BACL|nr:MULTISPECIES: EpsG family protein [Paenibacillus]KAA8997562.1 EpsG family protein [Paenibacillus spiritus]
MTILWLQLGFAFLCALLARYYAVPALAGSLPVRPNRMLVALTAVSFIAVAGLRNNIGDTVFYVHSYEITDFTWTYALHHSDMGFSVLQMLLQQISDDPQILIFTTALITHTLIIWTFYRYSRLFELSVYAFITSGGFVVSMNGIRQYLAAAIVFAATPYIMKGNWAKYMLVVLLAALIHQSALILIPIYFIVRREAWKGSTFALLGVAVAIVIGFNQFSELLFSAIRDTKYATYQDFTEGGANVLRVFFYAIPLVIAFAGRRRLKQLYPKIDILVNLSLIGMVLMIVSTQNWIFARVAIYFNLYQILLCSWVVKAFREKDQKLVYLALLAVYVLYFFYENVISLGLIYSSDYLP